MQNLWSELFFGFLKLFDLLVKRCHCFFCKELFADFQIVALANLPGSPKAGRFCGTHVLNKHLCSFLDNLSFADNMDGCTVASHSGRASFNTCGRMRGRKPASVITSTLQSSRVCSSRNMRAKSSNGCARPKIPGV